MIRKLDKTRLLMLCLLCMTASMAVFTVASAINGHRLVKPLVENIIVENTQLTIESLSFTDYNATANRYENVSITLTNPTSVSLQADIYVTLYANDGMEAAHATLTGVTVDAGGSYSIKIELVWIIGKDLSDVASGKIIVQQK